MRSSRVSLTTAVVAVFVLLAGLPSALGQTVPDFEDVPEGHVAEEAIEWAAQNGITQGVGNNRFGVGGTLTRYQMVTFLCRAFDPGACQSGVRGSDTFVDVPADHWANFPIGWAVNRGITSGVSATEFGGGQTLTREQMITFLYRAEGSPTGGSDGGDVFQDAPDRSHWASLAIGWAFDEGITGGIAAGTFGFGTNVSREEMVLFLCRTAAPGTCQPSQQPLPSSVVPTTTSEPGTAKPPDAEALIRPDEAALPVPAQRALRGSLSMPVVICAPAGAYTAADLEAVVTELNTRVGGFFRRVSSQMWDVVFTKGGIVSPDLQWEGLSMRDIYVQAVLDQDIPCRDAALQISSTSQILILTEAEPNISHCGASGAVSWAGGTMLLPTSKSWYSPVASWFPGFDSSDIPWWAEEGLDRAGRFLSSIAHEIARYELGIRHLPNMGLVQTRFDSFVYGDSFDTASLPCVYREQLGWPVGGDSPPCHRFGPSSPRPFVHLPTLDGFELTWASPSFTDGAPLTGFTLEVWRVPESGSYGNQSEGPLIKQELSSSQRSHTLGGIPPGRYDYRLRANTTHGSGAVSFGVGTGHYFVPPPSSVWATAIDSTSFRVSWSPVPGASHYLVWNSGDDPPAMTEIKVYDQAADDITEFEVPQYGEDIIEVKVYPSPGGGTVFLESEILHSGGGGTMVRGSTSLVLYNRQPNTEYTVKVLACGFEDVLGKEECSVGRGVAISTTPPEPGATPPGAVSSVSVAEAGDDWLVLSWDPVPGATFYECGYLTAQNTWFEGPGTADTSCQLWWDSRRAPPGIGLVAGNTYTVGVKACQKPLVNCTDWTTATASTQVLAAAPASYPVSVKEVSDTSFTLSWDSPAADAYYDLRVVTGLSRTFRVAGRTRDVTVPGLQPNTGYTVKVRTCRGVGGNCSSWVTIPVSTRSN